MFLKIINMYEKRFKNFKVFAGPRVFKRSQESIFFFSFGSHLGFCDFTVFLVIANTLEMLRNTVTSSSF